MSNPYEEENVNQKDIGGNNQDGDLTTPIQQPEIKDDFLAYHYLNYGINYDYSNMPVPTTSHPQQDVNVGKKLTKEEKLARKRQAADSTRSWVDIDEERNTNVYVSGLPATITDEEFMELMSKCGVIMNDPRTGKPKIKLYKNQNEQLKGDGTCCYIKMDSVNLALNILDGWNLNGHVVHVERAKFQMKGEFDPSKKKRPLTGPQKKRFFSRQDKLFEWKPDKPRNYRPLYECTVVLKNIFSYEEVNKNLTRINSLKQEVQELCSRFGSVQKVVLYDTNEEGVITVQFDNVECSDNAVKMLNGQMVAGRQIYASIWDGRTKFKREESQEEKEARDLAWSDFLGTVSVEEEG